MKKKQITGLCACFLMSVLFLTGCSFGKSEPAEQVIVKATETPVPTQAPTAMPTATPVPEPQTDYTSADGTVSIEVPDGTWTKKTDDGKIFSFESPDGDKILIIHGTGDDLNSTTLPDNEDMANILETSAGYEKETDYSISGYANQDIDGVSVISYVVDYLNTEKSNGIVQKAFRMYVDGSEYYQMEGTVKKAESMDAVKKSMGSVTLLNDSPLKAAFSTAIPDEAKEPDNGNSTGASQNSTGTSSSGLPEAFSDNYSEEAKNDTSMTRVIYRNSDGAAVVITPNDDGTWSDPAGNTYTFTNDEDVYDQNDVDFYYHGESANVYFMPAE